MKNVPRRLRGYFWVRENLSDEIEWARPSALPELVRPIVLVEGTFDCLNAGHLRQLYAARGHAGDRGTVVVALATDELALKEGSPCLLHFAERASAFNWLPADLIVMVDSKVERASLLRSLRPDLLILDRPPKVKLPVPAAVVRPFPLSSAALLLRAKELYEKTIP